MLSQSSAGQQPLQVASRCHDKPWQATTSSHGQPQVLQPTTTVEATKGQQARAAKRHAATTRREPTAKAVVGSGQRAAKRHATTTHREPTAKAVVGSGQRAARKQLEAISSQKAQKSKQFCGSNNHSCSDSGFKEGKF
ncbi:hypothetical protein Acr_25g0005520 [Actinidia rufa]|uniref:Uncharacterized protein n=1 Tax=Actinidia rufa TaxID=165716 RepID=A0A7J0GZ89_9ERIC|nr:hypothetical protein Acr_25g0005520 [Actinidia rufa]